MALLKNICRAHSEQIPNARSRGVNAGDPNEGRRSAVTAWTST